MSRGKLKEHELFQVTALGNNKIKEELFVDSAEKRFVPEPKQYTFL